MLDGVIALYCDGGIIGPRNPSPHGGTWAWVAINSAGAPVAAASGILAAPPDGSVGNNLAELVAALEALTLMPDGWAGTLYSDSQNTLGRLGRLPGQAVGWALNGVPADVRAWLQTQLARLGPFPGVLLQGHPTRADLAAGVGSKRGLPVSEWNVWCDEACQREARQYLQGLVGSAP